MKKTLIVIGICAFVAVVMIVYAFYFIPQPKAQSYKTTPAEVMNLQQTIEADGTVAAATEDDLGFQKSGVITSINVTVGSYVERGQVIATLDSATDQAAAASVQATLADMSRALTPQELAVQQATLVTAEKNAVSASADAYNKIQNAITAYSNTLFTSPQSANPKLIVTTQTSDQERQIENEQIQVLLLLSKWNTELNAASSSSADMLITDTQNYLATITTFINNLSTAVNALAQTSAPSQTNVTAYVATVNTANAAVVSAASEVTATQTALASAESNYNLKLIGNSTESIAAQAAKVQGAEAALAQDSLIAPISGIVTEQNSNVGEAVMPNVPFIHLISDTPYQVNVYVPEDSIGSIALNQNANVTLAAYGPAVIFPATVAIIDPGQTTINGVGMYKVTLQFTQNDPRIKDGMSATANIIVSEKDNVIAVPQSAVLQTNGSTTVLVVSPSAIVSQPVTTGITGANGWVEILNGLTSGETVATFGNQ